MNEVECQASKYVDCIYLATCSRDARLTRICIASIRYFYPKIPIRILPGDIPQAGLLEEVKKYWDVGVARIPEGDYGWGYVKLEPLFGPPGHSFMVVDVDTVFTGYILDKRAKSSAPFFVDEELSPDDELKRYYYDWEALQKIDPQIQTARKAFNGGQWFGTSGMVSREEFEPWIKWTMPRQQIYPTYFMGGEQGVNSLVIAKKEALDEIRVDRARFMRWPGNGLDGLDVLTVAARKAEALVIHWAGMKKTFLRSAVGGDLLKFFEDYYYSRLPLGRLVKVKDLVRHIWIQWSFEISRRIKFRYHIIRGRPMQDTISPAIVKEDFSYEEIS